MFSTICVLDFRIPFIISDLKSLSRAPCMGIVSFRVVWTYVILGISSSSIIWYCCDTTRFDVGYYVPCMSNVLSQGMINVACWGFCIFVRSTVIRGPVWCDGCGTLLFHALLCGITTVPFWHSPTKIPLFFFLTLSLTGDGDNVGRWYSSFILSTVWCGESSAELEKLGETWWNPWLSVIIKLFRALLSSPLIIRHVTSPLRTLIITISDTS